MIDISYDKNKLSFVTLNSEYKVNTIKNPEFRLYSNNEYKDGRLILANNANLTSEPVPLNKYRNPGQLFA